jgi:hypothetical protein
MHKGMNYWRKYSLTLVSSQSARTAIEPKPCNMVNTGYAAQHCRQPGNAALPFEGVPMQPPENGNHNDCMNRQ